MLERDGLIPDFHRARRPFGQIQILYGHLCRESKEIQGFCPGHQNVTVRSCRDGLGLTLWFMRKSLVAPS